MLRPGLFHIGLSTVLLLLLGQALAIDYSNPKSQVEYISAQPGDKPNIVPITRPPLLNQTPPPPPGNSKNFAYNPKSQTWTKIDAHDPQPDEDTLVWNQSNDKWLTRVPGS
ncbi:uncharacterized protein [Drosophila virilis]|uniref:Uncharacterized protein, isoform B n=1 Tax=Drosophila virilis TaxID=7244 RepID=A0A0Q9WAW4_DROVI|nr:uncharacterized protein LOC6628700 isoform X1 [Drosophila virilis]KRF81816.1 uncharacterized protein Dvir_GJ17613, isoform B [Drosophila virilis]